MGSVIQSFTKTLSEGRQSRAVIAGAILLIFASAILSHGSFAEPADLSYEATTPQECIYEKECVWYHLLLAVQADPLKQEITGNLNVRKWEEPIRFRVAAKVSGIKGDKINGWYRSVARFTTQKISVEDVENFLILFTEDIEKELEGPYRKTFKNVFGDDRILDHYRNVIKKRGDKCYYILLQDPRLNNAIYSYFAFIQKDHPDIQSCIKEAIYTGFGLSSIANSSVFKNYDKDGPYTDLEMLVLLVLSQDRIQSGMSFDELKLAFHEVYGPLMQKSEEMEVFNDH